MPSSKTRPRATKSRSQSGRPASGRAAAARPLPPYGIAIHEAMARGDVREMRRVAAAARKWLRETQAALDAMEKSVRELEG